jgi:hypothetical protein
MGKCQFVGVMYPGKSRKNAGSYVRPSWPISSNCLRVIEITMNLGRLMVGLMVHGGIDGLETPALAQEGLT